MELLDRLSNIFARLRENSAAPAPKTARIAPIAAAKNAEMSIAFKIFSEPLEKCGRARKSGRVRYFKLDKKTTPFYLASSAGFSAFFAAVFLAAGFLAAGFLAGFSAAAGASASAGFSASAGLDAGFADFL